jgi:hypothetical protein
MVSKQADKQARLVRLERALAAQIATLEAVSVDGAQPRRAPATSALPAGYRPLRAAGRALLDDPHLVAQAFARYLWWRFLLATRRPTPHSLLAVWRQLAGRFLWRAALLAQQHGQALPLRPTAPEPPAWVWQTAPASAYIQRATGSGAGGSAGETISPTAAEWWAAHADAGAAARLAAPALALTAATPADLTVFAEGDGSGDLGAWSDFATPGAAADLQRLARLVTPADVAAAAQAMQFTDRFGLARAYGISDAQTAHLMETAWNGQAVLWAQGDLAAAAGVLPPGIVAPELSGIGGAFNLPDPALLTYLRDQAGYRITGILEGQRQLITHALWFSLGGGAQFAPVAPAAAAKLLRTLWQTAGQDMAQMSRARALLISLTETARAESFGAMVGMYRLGVRFTEWDVTVGACLVCLGNAEQGPVPLYQTYPSGHQAPPAHPKCRCALRPYVPDTFNAAEWTPRDPQPLLDYFARGRQMTTWPEVAFDTEFFAAAGLPSDGQYAAMPTLLRASHTATPDPAQPYGWLVGDGGALLQCMNQHATAHNLAALGQGLSGAAELAAARWLDVARLPHEETPVTHDKLVALGDLLATSERQREALRQRLHAADLAYARDMERRLMAALERWRAHARHEGQPTR